MKKTFLATILTLLLIIGLASCGECTHEQYKVSYNASTHYKTCADCGLKDEATVEAHTLDLGGACACGCTFDVISYLDDGWRVYEIYYDDLCVKEGYLLLDGRGAYELRTYDDDGNILQEEEFNEDGVKHRHSLYEYNEAGLLVKKSNFYEGKAGSYSLYEYDASGLLIKEIDYEDDGELDDYDVFTYNANGLMIREDDYDEDGELDEYSIYEYDANGLKIKRSIYYGDGTLFYVAEYGNREKLLRENEINTDYTWSAEYNAFGAIIKEVFSDPSGYSNEKVHTRDASGNLLSRTTKIYYDGVLDYTEVSTYSDKGLLARIDVTHENAPEYNSYTVYTYDEKGIRTEQSTYQNGELHERVRFEYDEKGDETKQIFLDADGNVLYVYVYEYPDDDTMRLTAYYSDSVTVKEIVIWSLETGNILLEKEFAENGDVIFFYEGPPDGEGFTHQSEDDDYDCTTARHCTDCDFVFAPAREHTFENGYCQNCGKAE